MRYSISCTTAISTEDSSCINWSVGHYNNVGCMQERHELQNLQLSLEVLFWRGPTPQLNQLQQLFNSHDCR